jgi:hypothetical protein
MLLMTSGWPCYHHRLDILSADLQTQISGFLGQVPPCSADSASAKTAWMASQSSWDLPMSSPGCCLSPTFCGVVHKWLDCLVLWTWSAMATVSFLIYILRPSPARPLLHLLVLRSPGLQKAMMKFTSRVCHPMGPMLLWYHVIRTTAFSFSARCFLVFSPLAVPLLAIHLLSRLVALVDALSGLGNFYAPPLLLLLLLLPPPPPVHSG